MYYVLLILWKYQAHLKIATALHGTDHWERYCKFKLFWNSCYLVRKYLIVRCDGVIFAEEFLHEYLLVMELNRKELFIT